MSDLISIQPKELDNREETEGLLHRMNKWWLAFP
jgi:hypothetical protein